MEEKLLGSIGAEKSQYCMWRTWTLGLSATVSWFINTHGWRSASIDPPSPLLLKARGSRGTKGGWRVTTFSVESCRASWVQGCDIEKDQVWLWQKDIFVFNFSWGEVCEVTASGTKGLPTSTVQDWAVSAGTCQVLQKCVSWEHTESPVNKAGTSCWVRAWNSIWKLRGSSSLLNTAPRKAAVGEFPKHLSVSTLAVPPNLQFLCKAWVLLNMALTRSLHEWGVWRGPGVPGC